MLVAGIVLVALLVSIAMIVMIAMIARIVMIAGIVVVWSERGVCGGFTYSQKGGVRLLFHT